MALNKEQINEIIEGIKSADASQKKQLAAALGVKGTTTSATGALSDEEISEQLLKQLALKKRIAEANGQIGESERLILEIYKELKKASEEGMAGMSQEQEELLKNLGLSKENIEETAKKIEKKLSPAFKAGQDIGDKFAGSIARKLGMASDSTNTFIGKAREMMTTLGDPEALSGFVQRVKEIFTFQNMAIGLYSKIIEASAAMMFAVDTASAGFAAQTGAGRMFTAQIREVTGDMMQLGITADDSGKAMGALFSKFPGFINLSHESQVELGKNVVALGKLGVAADVSAGLMGGLSKSLKISSTDAAKMVKGLAMSAKAIGKTMATTTAEFQEASKYLMTYGKDSVDVFNKIASAAMAAGVEVSDVLALSKKFDTFSSAAQTAAQFNAVFGSSLSALNLVTMDVADRLPYLIDQFKATGQNFDEMDRYSQLAAAQILGFGDDVDKTRKILNMSTSDFTKYNEEQKRAAETQKEYDEALKAALPVMQKFKVAAMKIFTAIVPAGEALNSFADFVIDAAEVLKAYFLPGLGAVTIALLFLTPVAWKAIFPFTAMAKSLTVIAGALTGTAAAAPPAAAGIIGAGGASQAAVIPVSELALGFGALALGIGVAAAGLAVLVFAIDGVNNPAQTAIGTIVALGLVLGAMAVVSAMAAKPIMLTAGAIMAIGGAVAVASLGVASIVMAFGFLIGQFQTLNGIGPSAVLVLLGFAGAIYALGAAFATMTIGVAGMLAFTAMLGVMALVADSIARITESLAEISVTGLSAGLLGLSNMLDTIDAKIGGADKVEVRSTIENLALISTGQSSNTIAKGADTVSAIQQALVGLEKVFEPKIDLTVELEGRELTAFVKRVGGKG